jgi:hypothetical protein
MSPRCHWNGGQLALTRRSRPASLLQRCRKSYFPLTGAWHSTY